MSGNNYTTAPKKARAKGVKVWTRKQAEAALSQGSEPEQFVKHHNYHVRAKAWRKMGMPLPEDQEERTKFLASLHIKEKTEAVVEETTAVSEVVEPVVAEEMSF
jgi:hypothetical protein